MTGNTNSAPAGQGVCANFVEHLQRLARQQPQQHWLTVAATVDGQPAERRYTYGQLDLRVRALAASLQQQCAAGERALVMLDNDEHYLTAMLACFYSGVIAVPVPPWDARRGAALERVAGIAADSGAAVVLTSQAVVHDLSDPTRSGVALPGLATIAADRPDLALAQQWQAVRPAPDDIAFLQYTSGSTSAPKGVMVTHANLVANQLAIRERMAIGAGDTVVSWAPLYHDMGLIGGLLQPLFNAIPLVLCSPAYFLESPIRWLTLVARHRGTISGGPDFAYRLCLDRIKDAQLASLDLSSWRVAYSGAEPVRASTMRQFAARFAACGLAAGALYPCYGLAEATLMVTGGQAGAGLQVRTDGSELVDCGTTAAGHAVRIVDPDTLQECGPGQTGEIWASGPSICAGYWNRPEQSRATFVEQDGRRWLRTGDLGAIDQGGALFVAARIKDMIILRGQNTYPQDFEQAIEEQVEAVRRGRVAAFAVAHEQGEAVGVAAEISRGMQRLVQPQALVDAIAEVVAGLIGEAPAVVVLLNAGGMPKTSSGKLQRQACRQAWRAGTLDAYAVWERGHFVGATSAPAGPTETVEADEIEQQLSVWWAEMLYRDPQRQPARDAHFFHEGGNSLAATQLSSAIAARWSLACTPRVLFDAPRLRALAQWIRTARAAIGTASGAVGASVQDAIAAWPLTDSAPLSHAQRRQWAMWRRAPDSSAYHIGATVELDTPVDAARLEQQLRRLVAAHDMLRTVFGPGPDGQGEQRVLAQAWPGLQQVALAQDGLQDWLAAFAAAPFALEQQPPLRLALLQVGTQRQVLALVAHHILADARSLDHILDQVRHAPVTPAIPYRAYAAWENSQPADATAQAWWRQALGTEHPVLELPRLNVRGALAERPAGVHAERLEHDFAARLRAAAANAGATPFMLMLAAWHAVLYRYGGQHDVRVGVPMQVRPAGLDDVVGLFVNTVVIRTRPHGRMSAAALLAQARQALLDAEEHKHLPYEEVARAAQAGQAPLFQVLFNQVGGQSLAPCAPQFELVVELGEATAGGVDLRLVYATDRFAAPVIAQLAAHYRKLIEAFVDTPAVAIGDVALVASTQQPSEAGSTGAGAESGAKADAGAWQAVHQSIAARQAAAPQAVAVEDGQARLGDLALAAWSDSLAQRLVALGAGPERRIALMLERGNAMVAALLAVMKSGAAYVPLDPALPAARLAYMLQDSGAMLVLTDAASDGLALPDVAVPRLRVDRAPQPTAPLVPLAPVANHPEHLAYLIYTSGSTGRPKGVMVRHGALVNFMDSMRQAPGVAGGDVLVAATSLSFDIAGLEILLPLLVGARLVVASRSQARDGHALAALLDASQASVFQATPASWRLLLAAGWRVPAGRRLLGMCGGEALQAELAHALRQAGVTLWNMYGPTETTIWSSTDPVDPDALCLGRPIAATRLVLLDADLNLAPDGALGELAIGGAGLARGYHGRSALTAERFIASPLARHGELLYRTGDLARRDHDGRLHYLGRIDHQVKIRGYRIELGEIEAHLLQHPGVGAAVVVAWPQAEGHRLVAYVSPRGATVIDEARLLQALAADLPDYMVPQLMVLPALPLNNSGKVDRHALPPPRAMAQAEHLAPQGEREILLAQAWQQVLPGSTPHRDADFFGDGGDSLRVLKLVAALAAAGVEIAPERVFSRQTLRAIAADIALDRPDPIPRLADAVRGQGLPLSNAQARQWFLWQLAPHSSAYHISGTLHFRGQMQADAVQAVFRVLVARHESLRTVFRPGPNGQPEQWILPGLDGSHFAHEQIAGAEQLAARLQQIHNTPFALDSGPLLRVRLLHHQRDGQPHAALAVVIHHIVADGWSMQTLVDEFSRLYRAAIAGDDLASLLAPLPLQYADYAQWQRGWLDGAQAVAQLAWWRQALGDQHPVLELPADRPRRASAQIQLARLVPVLPAALPAALRERARRSNSSLFVVLLAAFLVLLHRHTRQGDVRIGASVTNRHASQTDDVVGFFVNAQVLRAQIDDQMSLGQVLGQARQFTQGAQANRELPFEALVNALQPGRDLSHSPLFKVVINHQQVDHRALQDLPGLSLLALEQGEQHARFELTLDSAELPDGSLQLQFLYAADLFDADTVARLAEHYLRLLQAVAEDDAVAVGAVPLHDARQAAQLARLARPSASGEGALLHHLFEDRARRAPEAIAVIDGGTRLRYGELNRQANRLAHALAARGIGPESRVGLRAGRSSQLVAAILGILKSGAAYVPLDPAYPRERLAYMAQASGLSLVLADDDQQAAPGEGITLLSLTALLASGPEHDPTQRMHPDALAYVIFTSGSSGRPKGAQLSHGNVARLLGMTDRWFGFGPGDVWTLFHSYAFDFSVWELFGALCSGGSLVVVPVDTSRSPEDFARLLREHAVTVLNQTPSAFRQLMATRELAAASLPALRTVIFGGEALDPAELAPWIARHGDQQPQLINMYGITETTVHVTWRRITQADLGRTASPIGCAIPDLGLVVLDSRLEPAGIDVPGELHVSGAGLARGYIGRAGLSAERFIANPFDHGGGRLYRTGDLARRRASGEIDYLGRIDAQVKLRGFRIEPGEIAAALRELPQVQEAAVVVGDDRLAAYVVADMAWLRQHRPQSRAVVAQWESVFDSAYDSQGVAPDFRGWDSSFTDGPIERTHMQEWLDQTVLRIAALGPRALLEIGCGVGLLVQRVAPTVPRYAATDLSPRAVADLGRWIAGQPQLAHVQLQQGEAAALPAGGGFDTVVLNSVAQYFPDLDYFIAVLRQGAQVLGEGGRFFVGDLRHAAHVPVFHAAIQVARAAPQTSVRALRERAARAVAHEKELAIDSVLFTRAAAALGFAHADIALKRGRFDNELTRYRYDVVLSSDVPPAPATVLAWSQCQGDLAGFARTFLAPGRPAVGLRGIPNARMTRDLAAWRLLHAADPSLNAAALRTRIDAVEVEGEDPELFWALAERHGWQARVRWSEAAADGRFDVDFLPPDSVAQTVPAQPAPLPADLHVLATDPVLGRALSSLGSVLRAGLQEKLPAHMIPASFTVLERMPLTANGKLDRHALPEPERIGQDQYAAPRGAQEQLLAGLWTALLGLERVGRDDHFFELGGHSLLATQLIARLRAATGVALPLRVIFERPVLQAMAAWLAAQQPQASGQGPRAVPRTPAMALSPMQMRLWLVDRLAAPAERAAYNMPAVLRLQGALDLDALQAALRHVVQRHEVLRTVYPDDEQGDPVALIRSHAEVALAQQDLAALPHGEQEVHVNWAISEQRDTPFDLAQGPVMRAQLLRLEEHQHLLLLCVHHIAFDGWSVAVFMRELSAGYAALAAGQPPALAPLPVQYADYADWHGRRLREHAQRNTAFWRDYLKDAPHGSSLAADGGDAATGVAGAAATLAHTLAPDVARRIAALARELGTSDYTLLLASFFLSLHRAMGRDELLLGTDVAGRSHAELEPLIGFFVNVVPLRSRLPGAGSIRDWLRQLHQQTQLAFEHQELPYEQIGELVQPRGARQPLVRMLFVMQNLPESRLELPGLAIEMVPQAQAHSKFDLALFLRPGAQGIQAEWVYPAQRYSRAAIAGLSAAWSRIVDHLLEDPGQPLASLGRLPTKENTMQQDLIASQGKLGKLGSLLKKTAPAAPVPLVRTRLLNPERPFPVVVEATSADIDADAWASSQRDFIDGLLRKHGGILFRNFGLATPQAFERFAEAMEPQLHGAYGDLPKKEGGRNTYRSTPYPERQMILYHNESAHTARWPRKQWFFCELPARLGGITPIVDCREMLRRLPLAIVEEMERRELLYIRTFHPGLDVSWQHFFKTEDRADVERQLRDGGIAWQWLEDDMLQTRTRAPAVITHPLTGERSFFNQVQLHHVSCLEPEVREDLLALVGADRLPRQVCYGDGTPIPDATMALIGELYEQCAVRFQWQKGDVVMLDNMLAAHARDPFEGERKVVVAMADLYDRQALQKTLEALPGGAQ